MSNRPFQHRVPPHILAQRQRWLFVGVIILVTLLIVLWLANIKGNFSNQPFFTSLGSLIGDDRPAQLIKADDILPATNDSANLDKFLNQIATASVTSTISTTSTPVAPLVISPSTLQKIKQKLK